MTSPAWMAPGLAPYQRVLLCLEQMGPLKKQRLANRTGVPLRAVEQMVTDGTIHGLGDGLLRPGRSPNYHGGANKAGRLWNREVPPV